MSEKKTLLSASPAETVRSPCHLKPPSRSLKRLKILSTLLLGFNPFKAFDSSVVSACLPDSKVHRLFRHACADMSADPPAPELDEETAKFMKAQGYVWNPKRRAWGRGNPASLEKIECGSSTRQLRWEGDQSAIPQLTLTCIRQATKRFEKSVRDARQEVVGRRDEENRVVDAVIRNSMAKPWAIPVWLAIQIAIFALLDHEFRPDLTSIGLESLIQSSAVGFVFAPFLTYLRFAQWQQVGVPKQDGRLERLLVDAQLGSYACPAPWNWRASDKTWRVATVALESIAGLNLALFCHGGIQSNVVRLTSGTFGDEAAAILGILAVATSAAARGLYILDGKWDGADAEVKAAEKLGRKAEVYYNMQATSPEEASLSIRATAALADAWKSRFSVADNAQATHLVLSSVSGAMLAISWELSGRSFIGPAFALAFSACGIYIFSLNEDFSRVTLELEEVASE